VDSLSSRIDEALEPIRTAHLFPKIETLLIELLRTLTPDEWEMQTVSPKWKVKDVAAHLLDTQLRKLSVGRDGHAAEKPTSGSPADLVAFVNRLNQEGVALYRRLSARVLISLMEAASRESAEYHQSLDPFAPAAFAVSWAGEERSLNWFDTAREFTERWHHQQQIRLAVNRPGIMTPELIPSCPRLLYARAAVRLSEYGRAAGNSFAIRYSGRMRRNVAASARRQRVAAYRSGGRQTFLSDHDSTGDSLARVH